MTQHASPYGVAVYENLFLHGHNKRTRIFLIKFIFNLDLVKKSGLSHKKSCGPRCGIRRKKTPCCEELMDQQNAALASNFVSETYIQQGADALATRRRLIKSLLSQRCLPMNGWDEDTVELFIKVTSAV